MTRNLLFKLKINVVHVIVFQLRLTCSAVELCVIYGNRLLLYILIYIVKLGVQHVYICMLYIVFLYYS